MGGVGTIIPLTPSPGAWSVLMLTHTCFHLPSVRPSCPFPPSPPSVLLRPPLPWVRQGRGHVAGAKHGQRRTLYAREPSQKNNAMHALIFPPSLPPLPQVRQGGGAVARAKHEQRGKLYVRERIERLVDPGTPFLELSVLAGREMYGQDKVPAGGIVTGK